MDPRGGVLYISNALRWTVTIWFKHHLWLHMFGTFHEKRKENEPYRQIIRLILMFSLGHAYT